MDFDYYKEYLTIISNKILLWKCWEKQIFINLTYDHAKIDHVKKGKEEKTFQILISSKLPSYSWDVKKDEWVHLI